MKKIIIQIHQMRFEMESRGAQEDADIHAAARTVSETIDRMRRQKHVTDSTRAATLAALRLALNAKNVDNTATAALDDTITAMHERIDATLARAADYPAEASTQ